MQYRLNESDSLQRALLCTIIECKLCFNIPECAFTITKFGYTGIASSEGNTIKLLPELGLNRCDEFDTSPMSRNCLFIST